MEKRKWLWKRRSSLDNKSPGEGESETTESMSSQSEKCSEEQPGQQLTPESTKGSPNHNPQSPEVTSKALGDECKKENDTTSKNSLLKKLSEADLEDSLEKNLTVESLSDGTSNLGGDLDESGSNEKEENDSIKLLKEKLSAALINVSLKDELVKQHSKVAEEAVEGWEKAESEAAVLKQEMDTLAESNTALEARSSQLDQALKECVRQLRLAKEDQERKISEAVAVKNKEFELSKSKLEKQIVELLSKVEAASPVQIDPEINSKLEFLERENQRLKDELAFLIEELEIRTIERDLSTKAAETASKQNLESIKMVAKLQSDCRKLKAVSRKSPILDTLQKSTPASSHSFDSEAIAFKTLPSSSGKIDFMDDFLEMEKLAAMPENGHRPFKSELPQSPSKDIESALREELKVIQCRAFELEEKVKEMEMASSQSQLSFENVEVELVETKMKLENLEEELQEVNELKMDYESYANDLKLEAQAMMSKIEQLQQEVDRQRVLSEKLSDRCQELESELHLKNEELEVERGASCSVELEEKERALDESRKRCDELENQYKDAVMRFENQEDESRIHLKAKETVLAEKEKCLEELQLKLKEAEMKLETQIAVYSSEIKEKETALAQNRVHLEELQIQLKETENKLEILQKERHEENVSKENLLLDLTTARAEAETLSAQIETLQGLINQEHSISAELSAKCEELGEELKQKEQELGLLQNVPASVEQKINQEDVANAAEKLAECQKTIASLGNQLKSLATLEDFLIDTASIPKFSGSAPLITNGGNDLWKFHSNNFKDPAGLHTFSKYVDGEVLDSSSSSSTNLYNSTSSQKRANGYEKLFPMRKG